MKKTITNKKEREKKKTQNIYLHMYIGLCTSDSNLPEERNKMEKERKVQIVNHKDCKYGLMCQVL